MKTLSILHSIKQGILICDKKSRILYFNEVYENYIGASLEEARGKKLTDFRPGAMVPEVLKNNMPLEGILRKEGDQEYFASVYPIMEGEELTGTISIMMTIEQSQGHTEQMTGTLEERVRKFEQQEIRHMMELYGSDLQSKKRIAAELGISLATLYNKLNEK